MSKYNNHIFSIINNNQLIEGCTISENIYSHVTCFSLSKDTSISPETHPYIKIIYVLSGILELYGDIEKKLVQQDIMMIPEQSLIGFKTSSHAIYLEIEERNINMNKMIQAGQVFTLKDKIPYQDHKIVNMDILSNDHMKFVLMAFDKATGLKPHAAPGEALIFALEGEAIIEYEGKEYVIKEGENFHFDKNGMHAITAHQPFKMALLLTLD